MAVNNGTFGLPLFDDQLLPRGIIGCILFVHLEQRQLLLLFCGGGSVSSTTENPGVL